MQWHRACMGAGMLHHVGRSVLGTLLIHGWPEARALWDLLLEAAPGADLVLMPDHFHLLAERPVVLAPAMSAFARFRNHRRGTRGPVWEAAPPPTPVGEGSKQRRTLRYVYLNPCRAGLVRDPLAWPFSTFRDALGLAAPAVRPRVPDPSRLHRYVTRDDTVAPGSELPFRDGAVLAGDDGLRAVEAAVSELTRRTFRDLRVRGPARTLLVVACRRLVAAPVDAVAAFVGVDARSVRRAAAGPCPELRLVERLLRDPRLPGLPDTDLLHLPSWAACARLRRDPITSRGGSPPPARPGARGRGSSGP